MCPATEYTDWPTSESIGGGSPRSCKAVRPSTARPEGPRSYGKIRGANHQFARYAAGMSAQAPDATELPPHDAARIVNAQFSERVKLGLSELGVLEPERAGHLCAVLGEVFFRSDRRLGILVQLQRRLSWLFRLLGMDIHRRGVQEGDGLVHVLGALRLRVWMGAFERALREMVRRDSSFRAHRHDQASALSWCTADRRGHP